MLPLFKSSLKISGKLPQVQLTLSDERILEIIQLALSITLPDAALPATDSDDSDSDYAVSIQTLILI